MLVSCQKESVTETVKTQKTEVSANERTAGSTWTNGEPAYYDEFGLPRWNEGYPRVVVKEMQRQTKREVRFIYYYDQSDAKQVISHLKPNKYLNEEGDLSAPCSPHCVSGYAGPPGCNCTTSKPIDITGKIHQTYGADIYSIVILEQSN